MDRQYFVAAAPGVGVIGILAGREIRHRLTAGSLRATDVCLPANATGDVASQWRPLSEVFGPPSAEGGPAPQPGTGDGPAASSHPPPGSGSVAGAVGQALLLVGQVLAAVGCVGSALTLFAAIWPGCPPRPHPLAPTDLLWLVGGSASACALSAALFVVFARVRRLPPG